MATKVLCTDYTLQMEVGVAEEYELGLARTLGSHQTAALIWPKVARLYFRRFRCFVLWSAASQTNHAHTVVLS